MRRLTMVVALTVLGLRPLAAQTIHGQVVEGTSGITVGAGFVVLLGADGKEVTRALADGEGRYNIKVPAPGAYRLRSERIGFKVSTSPAITISATENLEYRLEVSAIPIRLDEITISGETKCRVRPEEGRATATVWEEARKALAAVSWVQNEQRIRIRLRTYTRNMDAALNVTRERSSTRSATATRAFRAVPTTQLAANGYVEMQPDGGWVFQAPDADVLFSDQFLNSHCFRLAAPTPATPGMIGLGFEPIGERKVADINGVLWVDEKNAELRFVEFKYVNHRIGVESDLIGGRVDFERLANGGWLVSRFWIRMPQLRAVTERQYSSATQIRRGAGESRERLELAALMEEGGEVLQAFGLDGKPVAEALGATVSGTVYDSTRAIPLVGGEVRLAGTPFTVATGPGGNFELTGLPEGNYRLEFTHRDFPSWGWLAGPPVATRRGASITATLAVPAMTSLVRLTCPEMKGDDRGAAAGIVRDSVTGQPVRDAVVMFTWKDYQTVSSNVVNAKTMESEAGSDSTGYFRGCGFPFALPITARVMNVDREGPPVVFKLSPDTLQEVVVLRAPR